MDDKTKKYIEKYDEDFCRLASKDVWDPSEIVQMKDLQKIMYYLEIRDKMKNESEEGEEDWEDEGSFRSYAMGRGGRSGRRGRGGRSGRGGGGGGSGHYMYPGYPYDDYGSYDSYDGSGRSYASYESYEGRGSSRGGGSGRNYYDAEKDHVIKNLYKLMESKDDPKIKMAIENAIRELEAK